MRDRVPGNKMAQFIRHLNRVLLIILFTGAGDLRLVVDGAASCHRELKELLFSTKENHLEALDSFGRPQAGLLAGNTAWYGHYTECTNLEDYQYCLLDMDIKSAEVPVATQSNVHIRWGVCVPVNCTAEDIDDDIDMLLRYLRTNYNTDLTNVTGSTSCIAAPPIPYSMGYYITIGAGAVLCVLMILGSVVDAMEPSDSVGGGDGIVETHTPSTSSAQPKGDQTREGSPLIAEMDRPTDDSENEKQAGDSASATMKEALLAFALSRNLAKLMNVEEGPRTISCMHGMRVLSMLWIMAGHVFIVEGVDFVNTRELRAMVTRIYFDMLPSIPVDTFLFLSGVLVSYTTLPKLDRKEGSFDWHWFFIHRYLRLTPLMGAVLAIYMFIAPYMYNGPMTNHLLDTSSCEESWWANFLYIQNFVRSLADICYPITWYLAVDMQLFIISPVLVYALYREAAVGVCLIGLLLCFNVALTGILVGLYHFPASIAASTMVYNVDYGSLVYDKPYIRMPSYLIGILLGFLFHKTKDAEKPVISKRVSALGWLSAGILAGVVVFSLAGHHGPPNTNPSIGPALDIAYQSLHRYAWSIFLVWVVVSCQFDSSAWVSSILSWKAWIPLSRATYAAYLIHKILFEILIANHIQPYYQYFLIQLFTYFGVVTIGYICAVILHLAVELPVARLKQLYLPKP